MTHRFTVRANEVRRKWRLPKLEYLVHPMDITHQANEDFEIECQSYSSLKQLGKALAGLEFCLVERDTFQEYFIVDSSLDQSDNLFIYKRSLTEREFERLRHYIYKFSDKTSVYVRDESEPVRDKSKLSLADILAPIDCSLGCGEDKAPWYERIARKFSL